ncbi:hypothetical protein [Enterobacter phage vB_ExiM_F5M1E]|nr:hypothetical protein [Enterobacter phage vB_ExiM_F1M1E]UNA03040.1 hypothetical protein [Enterobacter phage vB_ExiM_F2M1E]UNA03361.1 hypothetical protein [Enterobacter phage vB_ExiM_F4M1E]UNA03682.1 hypothetical protein [Enterobacter phage vB_ExiM_F5M1E]UNA04002.1 hypothetical protein [Pantoea phage vB_PdiM_F5M2A]
MKSSSFILNIYRSSSVFDESNIQGLDREINT